MRTYAWLPPDQAAPADQRVQDRYFDRSSSASPTAEPANRSWNVTTIARRA